MMAWTGSPRAEIQKRLRLSVPRALFKWRLAFGVGPAPPCRDREGYTRDPNIHGRFESAYVDLIGVTEEDLLRYLPKEPRLLDDVWRSVVAHSRTSPTRAV